MIFSAWVSKLVSLMVLNRMLSCVITRLVSCPEEPPPVEEVGEPTVEVESDGECLAKREEPPTAPWDTDDRLASEEANRGLPEVPARERWPE